MNSLTFQRLQQSDAEQSGFLCVAAMVIALQVDLLLIETEAMLPAVWSWQLLVPSSAWLTL